MAMSRASLHRCSRLLSYEAKSDEHALSFLSVAELRILLIIIII